MIIFCTIINSCKLSFLRVIEPGAVVIPVQPELLLFLFAVVLELMIRGTLAFYAHQVQSPGIIVVLLHLHGSMRGEQQVIKPGVLAALIGREDLYIPVLAVYSSFSCCQLSRASLVSSW